MAVRLKSRLTALLMLPWVGGIWSREQAATIQGAVSRVWRVLEPHAVGYLYSHQAKLPISAVLALPVEEVARLIEENTSEGATPWMPGKTVHPDVPTGSSPLVTGGFEPMKWAQDVLWANRSVVHQGVRVPIQFRLADVGSLLDEDYERGSFRIPGDFRTMTPHRRVLAQHAAIILSGVRSGGRITCAAETSHPSIFGAICAQITKTYDLRLGPRANTLMGTGLSSSPPGTLPRGESSQPPTSPSPPVTVGTGSSPNSGSEPGPTPEGAVKGDQVCLGDTCVDRKWLMLGAFFLGVLLIAGKG